LLNKTTLDEQELFRQLSAGDPAALQVLIKAYYPILSRFAEKFLPDTALAQDMAQETFIKFWQYQGTFETFQGLKSFLFTVTRNGCLNLQRGRGREEDKHQKSTVLREEETCSAYDEITRLEYLGQINLVVRRMPPKMQKIFLLSFEEGLTIDEIATKLKISHKTVRNQKYKSLVILRNRFRNSDGSLLLLLHLLLKQTGKL